ncbi:MAG: hypothetical protein LBQ79_02700 [Deltaproteobacteria bacterium]|jgi:hypothetical protein|nr:hypothetical protein [Deltaproteobacteria bacterium]
MAAKNDFRADLTIASGSRLCRELGMSEARFWGLAHTEKRFPCHFERQPKAGLFTVRNLDSVYFDREEFESFFEWLCPGHTDSCMRAGARPSSGTEVKPEFRVPPATWMHEVPPISRKAEADAMKSEAEIKKRYR